MYYACMRAHTTVSVHVCLFSRVLDAPVRRLDRLVNKRIDRDRVTYAACHVGRIIN